MCRLDLFITTMNHHVSSISFLHVTGTKRGIGRTNYAENCIERVTLKTALRIVSSSSSLLRMLYVGTDY